MKRQVNYIYLFLVLRLEIGVRQAIGVNLADWSYKTTLISPNTAHVYISSNFAFTYRLHASACT
jgi:hypothetical protein